jgi:peptidoglycan/xylan/chitin deacetylase (PgdA/CDA1 family)
MVRTSNALKMYDPTPVQGKNLAPQLFGRVLWRLPFHFGIARLLGPGYSLRCVLFHDVTDQPSELTRGLGVTLGKKEFEARIEFLAKHYTPVDLSTVLSNRKRGYSRPPVLVTFDDAYASVAETAAPILKKYGIPALFFVNASLVGNHDLALDNLICYVANTRGLDVVCALADEVANFSGPKVSSLHDVFARRVASLSSQAQAELRARLTCGLDTSDIARRARIYIDAEQLRDLSSFQFEIGNHTYSHVFCRSLSDREFEREIYSNKAILEDMTGRRVRAFSVPYGDSIDLTAELLHHLRRSGHEAAFLVESRSNNAATDPYRINRVSVHAKTDADFFAEVEVFPRLRSLQDLLLSTGGHSA